MRRVIASLEWKSNAWLQKGTPQVTSPLTDCPYQLEGLRAYACRQANVFSDLQHHFLGIWKGLEPPREQLTGPMHPVGPSLNVMEVDGDDA